MTGQTWFASGKENFHVNAETVSFIMDQFFNSIQIRTEPKPGKKVYKAEG